MTSTFYLKYTKISFHEKSVKFLFTEEGFICYDRVASEGAAGVFLPPA